MPRLTARLRDTVHAFWFLPALIVVALLALALVLVGVDRHTGTSSTWFGFSGGASAARAILTSLAGSLITVAGLTFSIMIVTLQLVSGQYTPRALRTFLEDRLTQVVAGSFVGIFGYSLLVLRTVRGGDGFEGDTFVPSLAVSVAIVLGIVALGLLIVFVHHQSQSIQVSTITRRVTAETLAAATRLYPEGVGEAVEEDGAPTAHAWRSSGRPAVLRASRPGFVQSIDVGHAAKGAAALGVRLALVVEPGAFVTEQTAVAEVWPAHAADEMRAAVDEAIGIGPERTLSDDAAFGLRQLADIGLRALSPGVNDPTTAATCIGYLQAILEDVARRPPPATMRRVHGVVLSVRHPVFASYLETAFAELAAAAAGQHRVAPGIIDAVVAIADAAESEGRSEHAHACRTFARSIGPRLLGAAPTEASRVRLHEALASVTTAEGRR